MQNKHAEKKLQFGLIKTRKFCFELRKELKAVQNYDCHFFRTLKTPFVPETMKNMKQDSVLVFKLAAKEKSSKMPPQNLLRESCTWGYLDGEYPRGGLGYLDGDTRRGGCSSAPPPLRVPPIKVPPPLRVPPPGRGYPFSESWCLVFGEEKTTIVSLFFLGTPNSRCLANWEKLKKRRFQVTSYKLQVTSYKLF